MVTSTSDITGNSALAVRGTNALTAGLISAVVAGSILMAGSQNYDRGAVTTAKTCFGTGCFLSYTDSLCTNTGGLAKYTSCYLANPITGTAAIIRVQVDSNKAPNASNITCSTTTIGSTTQTGTRLFAATATASGSSIWTQTGSSITGANVKGPVILPGAGIRCWHSTTPGVQLKEQLRVWYNDQYVP